MNRDASALDRVQGLCVVIVAHPVVVEHDVGDAIPDPLMVPYPLNFALFPARARPLHDIADRPSAIRFDIHF